MSCSYLGKKFSIQQILYNSNLEFFFNISAALKITEVRLNCLKFKELLSAF